MPLAPHLLLVSSKLWGKLRDTLFELGGGNHTIFTAPNVFEEEHKGIHQLTLGGEGIFAINIFHIFPTKKEVNKDGGVAKAL